MISLQSVGKANIEKAKENFVNHVFSRTYIKICLTLGDDKQKIICPKNIDPSIFNLYLESKKIDFKVENIDYNFKKLNCQDLLKYLKINLYKLLLTQGSYQENETIGFIEDYISNTNKLNRVEELQSKNTSKDNDKRYSTYKKKVQSHISEFNFFFNRVLNYDALSTGYSVKNEITYNLYTLTENLGLRTCPYCNKNYIFTIRDDYKKSGKLVNATIDHWLPKSKYPWLQISFYNLIPSCSNCNSSIKSDNNFTHYTHLNPYLAPCDLTCRYSFEYFISSTNQPVITIMYKDKALENKLKNTFTAFEIEKLYNAQSLELQDMIDLSEAYSETYLDSLKNISSLSNLHKEKAYNMLFNTSSYSENHKLRPLSKFRYDMLKKLKIIDDKP